MEDKSIEVDIQQGVYKKIILAHFFMVSIVAISLNIVVLGIIIRRIYRGATVDLKLSALVTGLDFCAAVGTFIRAIICQSPRNLLVYSSDWCKFDVLFTTQLLLYSGVSVGVLSVERLLLVCYNKKLSVWVWIGVIFTMCGTQYTLFILNIVNDRQKIMDISVYCTVGVAEAAELLRAVVSFNLVSSYLMVVVSYISIMVFRYKQSLDQLNLNLPKEQVIREFLSTIRRSLVNIILYMIIYFGKLYCHLYEAITGKLRTWLIDYILVRESLDYYLPSHEMTNSETKELFPHTTETLSETLEGPPLLGRIYCLAFCDKLINTVDFSECIPKHLYLANMTSDALVTVYPRTVTYSPGMRILLSVKLVLHAPTLIWLIVNIVTSPTVS